jgi:hypothetical protein
MEALNQDVCLKKRKKQIGDHAFSSMLTNKCDESVASVRNIPQHNTVREAAYQRYKCHYDHDGCCKYPQCVDPARELYCDQHGTNKQHWEPACKHSILTAGGTGGSTVPSCKCSAKCAKVPVGAAPMGPKNRVKGARNRPGIASAIMLDRT